MQTSGVLDRVLTFRAQMPATMARVAAVLEADPAAPLELSITGLAERAGTSAATVTRLCRLLGFSGYPALRVAAAQDVGRGDRDRAWLTDFGDSFAPGDSPSTVLSTLLNAQLVAIRTTAQQYDLPALTSLATRIRHCQKLDVYAVAGSGLVGRELAARLARLGVNAHAHIDRHSGLPSAALLGENCVALGISNHGDTEDTLGMLSEATRRRAWAVAITSSPETAMAAIADQHITAASPHSDVQPDEVAARHAQLLTADLLYLLVAQVDPALTARTLAATAEAFTHRV
ncbi:MurR/RpiR family transcriptional regulator [Kribbella yunnanensis]|uniref:MurR/RpiR family transcriptional regulator n=1 Tax=Kribbella yunnanensis TaxID=190194 RepID=A0ABP4SCW1_9ACTN